MPSTTPLSLNLPGRAPIKVYVLELADGRVVSRTEAELQHASNEERIAAGLEPLEPQP